MKRKVATAFVLTGLLAACNRAFYHPSAEIVATPAARGHLYEDVTLRSEDGVALSAWRVFATAPRVGLVVHFHGNAENMSTHASFVLWLTRHGYDVLVFDYRGYGRSEGAPDRAGSIRDGIAALRYADAERRAFRGALVVLGQSLGGAIAIPAVVRSGVRPTAVVVESAFASYREVAWDVAGPLAYLVSDEDSPVAEVAALGAPLLVVHGDADGTVAYRHAELLYAAAGAPKELWRMPGAGHTAAFGGSAEGGDDPWRARLVAWLQGVTSAKSSVR